MEVVIVVISPRLEWMHIDNGFAARGNDLLEVQIAAFELRHNVVEVLDVEDDLFAGGRMRLDRKSVV